MGGPSGGGGTSSTTNNQTLPWAGYVPPETYAAYKSIMPQLQSKYDVGLTPKEQTFYRGQALKDTEGQFAGASQSLADLLARSGVKANSGAALEAASNLRRGAATSGAAALGNVTGIDISRKDANTNRLLQGIGLPGAPIVTGSTTSTKQSGGS